MNNSIQDVISKLSFSNDSNEDDVGTKLAIPLFQLLGYDESKRAGKFPIYPSESRPSKSRNKPKIADIVYFDDPDFDSHKNREEKNWVQDHTLIIVELKKPAIPIEKEIVKEQAEFYTLWARASYYVITNGKSIIIYRTELYHSDIEELNCTIDELDIYWPKIQRLLNPDAVIAYRKQNGFKTVGIHETNYINYISAFHQDLKNKINNSINRTISSFNEKYCLGLNIKTVPQKSIPIEYILDNTISTVILADTGGGKTYLTKMLAYEAINKYIIKRDTLIPIIINAKQWNRSFKSISEAIKKEVSNFVPGLKNEILDEDIKNGLFLIIIDGFDEINDSVDTFVDEIINISRKTKNQIIVTSRSTNYYFEFAEQFEAYEIDALTDNQITEYAAKVIGNEYSKNFLYDISPSLREIIHNPLFLIMTINTIVRSPSKKLPANISELYTDYMNYLLTDWLKMKSISRKIIVDKTTKELILVKFAQKIYENKNTNIILNNIIGEYLHGYSIDQIRYELFTSGIIEDKNEGPEFYHKSIQEYYLSRYLILCPDIDIANFIQKYHVNGNYNNVFIFLSGLLDKLQKQSILLNYLESNNLPLYTICLKSRFNLSSKMKEDWSKESPIKYLNQIRDSYLNIINSHFKSIKNLFPPWQMVNASQIDKFVLIIEGNINTTIPEVSYRFKLVNIDIGEISQVILLPESKPEIKVSGSPDSANIPIINLHSSDGLSYYNLKECGLNIDSAREVAYKDVKNYLKAILQKKLIIVDGDYYSICEHIEKLLKEIGDFQIYAPADIRNLSLRSNSISEICEIFLHYINENAIGFILPSGKLHKVNFIGIHYLLTYLNKNNVNPNEYLLTPQTIDVNKNFRPYGPYIWNLWSEEDLCDRIKKYYDYFQKSYRIIVEKAFPTLKDNLYFYKIGPVRYNVLVYINKETKDYTIYPRWEPILNSEKQETIIKVTYIKPNNEVNEEKEYYNIVKNKLSTLNRKTDYITYNPWASVSIYLEKEAVLTQVYKQISNDIKHLLEHL